MQSSQASSSETLDVSRSPQPLGAHGLDQEKAAPAQTDVPDGGLKAWMTVCRWIVAHFVLYFWIFNAFGVFEDYYARDYLTSKIDYVRGIMDRVNPTVSSIHDGSVSSIHDGPVSGKLFDLGYFHWCIGIGSLIYLVHVITGHKNEYYQVFLPQAIGLGLSQGLLFLPSVGVISHHFKKRRSLAMGIVLTGSSCGGIIFPVMLNNIIKQSASDGRASYCDALLLPTDDENSSSTQSRSSTPPPPDILAGSFLIMLGIWFPIFYVQLFAIVHDIDANLAFYSLAILNASSIFGRTIPNLLADKFGISTLLFLSAGALIVFSILYGFFSGAFVSLISPMFVALARHMHEVGARLGLGFAVVGIATLIGTPISGALLTDENLWYRPIVFAGS
ncbi:transporter MCH4 [Ceratobasidium sp. AG-Ba]|nr:transporter MCH4 [Ceratobasidium sp. AG-Ba]